MSSNTAQPVPASTGRGSFANTPPGSVSKITGIANERALTANEHVNWCPYYHPDGRHFVYGSSEMGHSNYEVMMRDAERPDRSIRSTDCPGIGGMARVSASMPRTVRVPPA
jgi:hypothetical protein